ncbi:MAG: hypothetical protein ABJM36_10825 [Algibacter sp.]|uniref:hypothetical protein n=1 Tax=Algibacter sp. TaxID=1872428 RepID=UPI0032978A80
MKLVQKEVRKQRSEDNLKEFLINDTSISVTDVIGSVLYVNNNISDLIEIPNPRIVHS